MGVKKMKWWKILLITLAVLFFAVWVSGYGYLYKALVYNYVNIDDLNLFSVRTVKAGDGEPWPLGHDYNKKQLTPELQKTLEQYRSVAFLVIKDDSLRLEKYWESYGSKSLSNSFSMAKSIVSILVGIAFDEGKIESLDQPVCDFLPEFCDGKEKS
jgi:hypothetical protein